ncbi:hypothetical protein BDV96DRAFT_562103 [Lophiotrema nucula]|uniref:Uncharacterized protein n=1 Tax=Lophiotrema nucula TaxID=690887 RepID=A0A6A5ZW80_9PLEO|nr:hypothetical protein BDV96DRAFT_562103 [Lophiotrema nucula]
MKSYLAAAFIAQSYYGDLHNSTYAANLCWYVESSLLEGLWIPTPDAGHGAVDAESSFCATSGYYGKDEYFQYTNATQTADAVVAVSGLVTKVMARVLQVVLKSEDEVEYICTNFGRWEKRIDELGIVSNTLKEEVCGGDGKAKDLAEAKTALLGAMTDLYSFQLLHAGNAADYPEWLCDSLKKDGLTKAGLDGTRIVGDACKAAKSLTAGSQ